MSATRICSVCKTPYTLSEPCERQTDPATVEAVVAWLRGIPLDWREDWGLNATEEIADLLESGLWLFDGSGQSESVDP